MKNTINITVEDMAQYVAYKKLFTSTGYAQIGTRLFEDNKSYVRITIKNRHPKGTYRRLIEG